MTEQTNGENKPIPIGQMSIDARVLYDRIRLAQIGELIGYSELSELIGRDVRSPGAYGALQTARRNAQREDRIVFDVIANRGLLRLNDLEIIGTQERDLRRTGRLAHRMAKRLVCVDYDSLPNQAKVKHNVGLSLAGALRHMTKPAASKKLEGAISAQNKALPIGRTLELFKS